MDEFCWGKNFFGGMGGPVRSFTQGGGGRVRMAGGLRGAVSGGIVLESMG